MTRNRNVQISGAHVAKLRVIVADVGITNAARVIRSSQEVIRECMSGGWTTARAKERLEKAIDEATAERATRAA